MGDLEQKIVISEKKRNALVASGGGLKAHFFHIGVGIRLEEEGFKFRGGLLDHSETQLREHNTFGNKDIDMYIGSSGGSIFSIGVALGHSPEELYRLFMDDSKLEKVGLKRGLVHYINLNPQAVTQVLKGMRRALKEGLNPETLMFPMSPFDLGPLERRLHHFLETEDFTKVASDLFVVTTPLNFPGRLVYCRKPYESQGEIIYRNDANISSSVAGSCSLQFLHPHCIRHQNGDKFDVVDGETRRTLSYRVASDHGADLVFVSYTHVPYNFDPKIGSLKKQGVVRVAIQSIYLLIEEKIQSSRRFNEGINKAYDAVIETFERLEHDLPNEKELIIQYKNDLLARLARDLDIKRNVDYVFISPDKDDHDFYFDWHLGMSQDYIERTVQKGYLAADKALEKYRFL